MRMLSVLMMFVALGVVVNGQNKPVTTGGTAIIERSVKSVPFSAEAVNESVQALADGNRITRTWSYKIYRNSDGRMRREVSGQGSAFGGALFAEPAVTIMDPGAGFRYQIDKESKTARTMVLTAPEGGQHQLTIVNGIDDKVKAELEAARAGLVTAQQGLESARVAAVDKMKTELMAVEQAVAAGTGIGVTTIAPMAVPSGKGDSRTEQLGVQNIEGVEAEGTRTITTIPAGAIGNERSIEIVYERWFSKELQQVVYSKRSDPRFGEQTYRLTNINRSEPDPSLFSVPNGYRLRHDDHGTPGAYVYAAEAAKAAAEQVYTTRPTTPPAAAARTKKPNN